MNLTDRAIAVEHGRTKFPHSPVLMSSVGLNWSGIRAERRAHPGGEIPDILPRVTELTLALNGNPNAFVRRSMGGERQSTAAASGTLWLCPEGLAEDSISISGALPDILHVYLPRALFTDLSGEDGYPDVHPECLHYKAGFIDPLIEQLAKAISVELESPGTGGRLFVESAALTLCSRLVRAHASLPHKVTDVPAGKHDLGDKRLRRVVDFIEAHLEDDLGVNELAAIACLSPFYFSRAFKQATGQSPYRYLGQRRIEHAKTLLLNSRISLAEVASRCQFASQASFTRAFTAAMGCSPGRFRQNSFK
ncbi:AraC family transcriptional regulator [Paraburkholderia sp. GAS199]|uniref:helix-turn-helix domain-containing protein n=1 Tax=Paraburkholderia sp. GAS199 TaxID=3035126 RepID=UPI003D1DF119